LNRRSFLLAAPAALAGCAALETPQADALRAAGSGLPRHAEQRGVPFFPQQPYHCGPAALATVLVHAGFRADPDVLAEQVFLPAREGTLQLEMLSGARRAGALPVRVPGSIESLLHEEVDGHPPVVLLNLGLSWLPRWHYAVVVGHDLDAGELVLRSGTTERALFEIGTFEHVWTRAGSWAFVVVRPGDLPRSTSEEDALQAALGFEHVGAPREAARVWQSLLERWPDRLVSLIGLGNAQYAAHDLRAAAMAFERAARLHDSAAAWNNLAQTRHELGDVAGARDAAQRAIARARAAEPQMLDAAQRTLRDLSS
jgi:tetratricopeptide (TPR) repeat protein